jgi:DNA-binding transcriptional MerR regulator
VERAVTVEFKDYYKVLGVIEIFQPKPDILYSLNAAAHLAGVSRRSILLYCRAGLVRPVAQPVGGTMEFTEETICTIRQINYMRTVQGLDLLWIKTILDLAEEVARLRTEVRFLRNQR